jgi:shikimate kinase
MNIFLIGFMGSGKSTIGKILSAELKMNFVDVDHVIEKQFDQSIGQIFNTEGEEQFRLMEHKIIKNEEIIGSNSIVSVGGGLPCFHDNMNIMNSIGVTVYLKMSAKSISERLWNLPESARAMRPLLANKSKSELNAFIENTLENREPFYNKAKLIISNETFDASVTAGRIKTVLSYL